MDSGVGRLCWDMGWTPIGHDLVPGSDLELGSALGMRGASHRFPGLPRRGQPDGDPLGQALSKAVLVVSCPRLSWWRCSVD
jgi:hypothetical protein